MIPQYVTLAGLKSLAKKLKREQALPHHQALDLAARLGNYECYAHALKHLPNVAQADFAVSIKQKWWGYTSKEGGTAEISINLKHPLDELVKPHHLVGYLGSSKLRNGGVVERVGDQQDASQTQWFIARIARALQFMDVTGLKPSRSRRCYPRGLWDARPPIADHDHCWFDPEAKVHVLSTEPYPGRSERRDADQQRWEQEFGWTTTLVDRESIYGSSTELYLCCPSSYAGVLARKVARLERAGPAVKDKDVTIEKWPPPQ